MALDILISAQGRDWVIMKPECCVYIQDTWGTVSLAFQDTQAQIKDYF